MAMSRIGGHKMNPIQWAQTVVDYTEQQGIVGSLLPQGAADANDRYQPQRVYASYSWSGDKSADTLISFRIKTPADRPPLNINEAGWTAKSTIVGGDWGDDWEEVAISKVGDAVENVSQEFHAPDRFRIKVSICDEHITGDIIARKITVENLRETGGILHALRIGQSNLPSLHTVRPFGIDEDIYYRAGGLIGTLSSDKTELSFSPYALLPEPIRRPKLGPTLSEAVERGLLSATASLLRERNVQNLFEFQADSICEIRSWLADGPKANGLLLTGGTAAGKTEAFLMPLLENLADDTFHPGVKGLFVYPTKSLAGDQASRFFWYLARFNRARDYPISIGILDGDIPYDRDALRELERRRELRTPFSQCPEPECGGQIMFTIDHEGSDLSVPTCDNCRTQFSWLRLHKKDVQDYWPNLLLTNPDMLHRQISGKFAWMGQGILGRLVHVCADCGKFTTATHNTLSGKRAACVCNGALGQAISTCPLVVVFDESHLYKGIFGSQVAMLIARVRRIATSCGHAPTFVGVSATIATPESFGAQLFGGSIQIIRGQEEKTNEPPTRHHLFLMPIQVTVLNAVGHILAGCFVADQVANEENRVLVFSDAKRTVYQLEASLPEFYAGLPGTVLPSEWPTASTRSHTGDHSPHERRTVEMAFDRGDLRVLLATQTLEVGVDFRNLQLEIQTGATYSYNDYIQRVGRAGRQGVPALVICILRPQVPLDYYYFEHCRELVQFSDLNLDDVPLRTDNPYLIERHVPAAVQDYLIGVEEGAKLMWRHRDAMKALADNKDEVFRYLCSVFISSQSEDVDLIKEAIDRGFGKAEAALSSATASGETTERLSEVIHLTVRSTDAGVEVESDDFSLHKGISLSGEIGEELIEEMELPESDKDEEEE
jgi:superfamily II DNA/RNA helicase